MSPIAATFRSLPPLAGIFAALLALPAGGEGAAQHRAEREAMLRTIERHARSATETLGRGQIDPAVLRVMGEVPRHAFVPANVQGQAYDDRPLPIGYGQTISQPFIVALMTDMAAVGPQDVVLEVGTGSGYQAAVLSRLAGEVVSIERYRTLAEAARARLAAIGCGNVEVMTGDGWAGVAARAPFDRIMVTAAAETLPQTLLDQLADGGIMVLPLGRHQQSQHIVKLTKSQTGLVHEDLIPVRFVPLMLGEAQEL